LKGLCAVRSYCEGGIARRRGAGYNNRMPSLRFLPPPPLRPLPPDPPRPAAAPEMPWDRRAPERAGPASAWALLPEDFAAQGCPGRPAHVFARLQRVRTWQEDRLFLSRAIRAWLAAHADLSLPEIRERHPSGDGSTRLVLSLADGQRIEAVHMPRMDGDPRVTYCISSQVGCALGCTFCATGAMGIVRNLTAGEIVGQVLALMRELGPRRGDPLYLVFMGMGEPLHNLDHVHRAITVLCHPEGAGLSARRITLSTAGLVAGLEKLARLEPRPQLAVSLNATTDAARSAVMPVNRAWNLARLRRALDAWQLKPQERFTFEYVLLAGQNDTPEDADRLAAWLGDLRHRNVVNLIPMNQHPHSPFREPTEERLQAFAARLHAHGCFITVRRSRGRDVQGACGQLVRRGEGAARVEELG
jgi:23S rRNA (adenine2503-C2)-methyltransferase